MQFSTRQTTFCTLLLFVSFDTWNSTLHLTEMWALHSILARCISPVTASNFKVNIVYFQLSFWIFVYTSVIIGRDKRSLCGGGRRRPIDLLPRLFRPSYFVKKGVDRQRTTSWPQPKMLLALLKRKAFFLQLEKGLRFFNLLQSGFWIWITQRFSFVGECDDFLQCFVTLQFKMKLHQLWRIGMWLSWSRLFFTQWTPACFSKIMRYYAAKMIELLWQISKEKYFSGRMDRSMGTFVCIALLILRSLVSIMTALRTAL